METKYLISGKARRALKKEVAELKNYLKYFWHLEDINRVYGMGSSDEECIERISEIQKRIDKLSLELSKTI